MGLNSCLVFKKANHCMTCCCDTTTYFVTRYGVRMSAAGVANLREFAHLRNHLCANVLVRSYS